MDIELKRWIGLGAAAALLAACGGEGGEAGEYGEGGEAGEAAVHGEAGEGEGGELGEGEGGEGGEAGHGAPGAVSPSQRAAFMAGHVAAGLALYRAGAPDEAAPHLLHPVAETHASEREGLEALGFDARLFETVSAALEAGQPAEEIEPQLAAAEANIAEVRANAGGSTADLVDYLMDLVAAEYPAGVSDGNIINAGEYQDAFGFVVIAQDEVARASASFAGVGAELDALLALWPGAAPLSSDTPPAVADVLAAVSRVKLELSDVQ